MSDENNIMGFLGNFNFYKIMKEKNQKEMQEDILDFDTIYNFIKYPEKIKNPEEIKDKIFNSPENFKRYLEIKDYIHIMEDTHITEEENQKYEEAIKIFIQNLKKKSKNYFQWEFSLEDLIEESKKAANLEYQKTGTFFRKTGSIIKINKYVFGSKLTFLFTPSSEQNKYLLCINYEKKSLYKVQIFQKTNSKKEHIETIDNLFEKNYLNNPLILQPHYTYIFDFIDLENKSDFSIEFKIKE
ncbi:MAG: hypothetical protein KatS3mg068_2683 [Candidatus Sericytochromatia bacterium]|nr:MAG: hypothetical protein KatS3mg068_2683 [Candidatus Sericytochromatia bacterium]